MIAKNNMTNYISENMQLSGCYKNPESNEDNITYDNTTFSKSTSLLLEGENFNDDLYIDNDQVLNNTNTLEHSCMIDLVNLLEDTSCPDSAVTRIVARDKKL